MKFVHLGLLIEGGSGGSLVLSGRINANNYTCSNYMRKAWIEASFRILNDS